MLTAGILFRIIMPLTPEAINLNNKYSREKVLYPKNVDRLVNWMEGLSVPPITAMICPTDRCNSFCPRCVGGREGIADLGNIFGVIDQLADYGCKSLVFSGGGEPLINKETPQAIIHSNERGMDVALLTNGTVTLDGSDALKILSSCNWVRFSLDASNPEEYLHTHGLGEKAFTKVLQNLEYLVAMRKKYSLMSCELGIGYLTDAVTKKGMYEATKIFKGIGLDYIQFRPFFFDETSVDSEFNECLTLDNGDFRVLRSSYRYDRDNLKEGRQYSECLSHYFSTTISATGKVYICCHTMGNEHYVIGDLNKQAFQEIWEGEERKRVISSIDFKDCPPICKWHTMNCLLSEIKSIPVTENGIIQISELRSNEYRKNVSIL